jgi:hypothetical protein
MADIKQVEVKNIIIGIRPDGTPIYSTSADFIKRTINDKNIEHNGKSNK